MIQSHRRRSPICASSPRSETVLNRRKSGGRAGRPALRRHEFRTMAINAGGPPRAGGEKATLLPSGTAIDDPIRAHPPPKGKRKKAPCHTISIMKSKSDLRLAAQGEEEKNSLPPSAPAEESNPEPRAQAAPPPQPSAPVMRPRHDLRLFATHHVEEGESFPPPLDPAMKPAPDFLAAAAASQDDGVPISVKIRERLRTAGRRFHANDNIADFIGPGELDRLQDEVADKMQRVLRSLVIDIESDRNAADTARRVARMYVKEVFGGRYTRPPAITEFPNVRRLNELIIVGPLAVRSACSHHLCPVIGKLWVGVMPSERSNVIGLSKYARLAEWVMGRPQIQEEAVVQLADLIEEKTHPVGLAVVMQTTHFCMAWRGVKDMDSRMINSVMRGVFLKDTNLRREFLSLIPRQQ